MKELKKIIAVASALAIMFSLAACNGDEEPTVSLTETKTTEESTTAGLVMPEETEPVTEVITSESTTETATTEAPTEAVTAGVNVTQAPETETNVTTTAPPKKTAPSSKADIVKLYNDATATASKNKPGYSKSVNTTLSNFEMGALSRFDFIRGAIGSFLGEGKMDSVVSKGDFDGSSLCRSTLKASDVTSATCSLSPDGKYYIVKITVKNETNPLKGSSAIGRFTRDYKDANEIKAGLEEVGAGVGKMTVKTSSVVIEAKISTENGRFSSLKHSFRMSAEMTDVKYSVVKVNKASAKLATTVTYSSFKY